MTDIRPANAADAPFLQAMLGEAVNWAGQERINLHQIRSDAALSHYVEGWPRSGDFGFVAVDTSGQPVGAAWGRVFSGSDPGYGFVAADVPEVTIAVHRAARGIGVGRALLSALTDEAQLRRITRLSLSVEDGNPARHLYESLGFAVIGRSGDSDTMRLAVDDCTADGRA